MQFAGIRTDMDFNQIVVHSKNQTRTINLNEQEGYIFHEGVGVQYDDVTFEPVFSKAGDYYYTLTLTFFDFSDFDTLEVTDMWGNGVRINNS